MANKCCEDCGDEIVAKERRRKCKYCGEMICGLTDERLKEIVGNYDKGFACRSDEAETIARELLLLRADAAELARTLQALKNKTEAIAKAVDPYIALASLRAGEDIYRDGPKMQPEVSQADELLSRPSVVNLMKEKDQ